MLILSLPFSHQKTFLASAWPAAGEEREEEKGRCGAGEMGRNREKKKERGQGKEVGLSPVRKQPWDLRSSFQTQLYVHIYPGKEN